MKFFCPKCNVGQASLTNYQAGGTVQCNTCHHKWIPFVLNSRLFSSDPKISPRRFVGPTTREVDRGTSPDPATRRQSDADNNRPDNQAHPAPADASFFNKKANIAATIGAVAVLVGGLIIRNQVFADYSSAFEISRFIGPAANRVGLEFVDLQTTSKTGESKTVLLVSGRIRNITSGTIDVPPVRLTARNINRNALNSWVHYPDDIQLSVGQSVAFSTRLDNPPAGIVDIQLKFTKLR